MNLVDKLMQIDKEEAAKKETKEIKCKRLSKLIGEDVTITIQSLSGHKINDIMGMAVDKSGNKIFSKAYDVNLMYCVEGITCPSLKDNALMEHFGASTPKDLATILLGVEANAIADEILGISGFDDDTEDEVKN